MEEEAEEDWEGGRRVVAPVRAVALDLALVWDERGGADASRLPVDAMPDLVLVWDGPVLVLVVVDAVVVVVVVAAAPAPLPAAVAPAPAVLALARVIIVAVADGAPAAETTRDDEGGYRASPPPAALPPPTPPRAAAAPRRGSPVEEDEDDGGRAPVTVAERCRPPDPDGGLTGSRLGEMVRGSAVPASSCRWEWFAPPTSPAGLRRDLERFISVS